DAYRSNKQGYTIYLSCAKKITIYNDFFFSSRRRHTRSKRDWSSDVCSSDLRSSIPWPGSGHGIDDRELGDRGVYPGPASFADTRSEERRVGKECRSGWTG